MRSEKKRVSGWMSIKEPADLEKALVRMLNKILSSERPIEQAGRFASLANSWLNARKLALEIGEWKEIKNRLELVEQAQAFDKEKAKNMKEDLAKIKSEREAITRELNRE
jgi:hypothetical protein